MLEVLPVQGAAIDGSEDIQESPEVQAPRAPAVPTDPTASQKPSGTDALPTTELSSAEPSPVAPLAPALTKEAGIAPDSAGAMDAQQESNPAQPANESTLPGNLDQKLSGAALEQAKAALQAKLKPLPEAEPAKEQDADEKGPFAIAYRDLTLVDYDVDAMLDYMLFPEEYEGEEIQDLQFPPAIKKLDGKVVSLVGYMIPGEMEQGNVLDFMLVRDLLGCCFGGTPMPDEWVDVVMEEGAQAAYRPYMPTRVTGVLTLGGDQDEAGFALGVYKLKGTQVTVED